MVGIIYQKDIYYIKEKRYILIGIRNVDSDIFQEIVKVFKDNFVFYLPEVKSWFIREYGWNKLVKAMDEKISPLIDDVQAVREELLTEVGKKMQEKLELDEAEKEDYDDKFRKTRAELTIKYDGKCQVCQGYATTCHHIQPVSFEGGTKKANLVLLCSSCHGKLHAYYRNKAQRIVFEKDKNFFRNCLKDLQQEYQKLKEAL